MKTTVYLLLSLCLVLSAVGCKPTTDGDTATGQRHYDVDYNFLVTADSLVLQEFRPMHMLIAPESSDSMTVGRGDPLVVAQFEIIPEDSIDSVWVKVARDQLTQGWIHESALLEAVVPDDPISQGMHLFRGKHFAVALGLCLLALVVWIVAARIVRSRNIVSPYPALLCLTIVTTAALGLCIRLFQPDVWEHYYFHPTLNPFGQPTPLALLLGLAWLVVVLLIATADDLRNGRPRFHCGQCGTPLHKLGECPECGAVNQ